MQETYSIKGMHCQSCVRRIEQGLAAYADSVRVSLEEARLYLTAPRLAFKELKNRLAEIGTYELLPFKEKKRPLVGLRPYYPLILIVAYLIVVSLADASSMTDWMRHFMAGFFLIFSFFKILNLSAFANGYAKYDLLAMRWKPYGFIYPFCELGLGLAYLFNWQMNAVLWATLILMGFSSLGVVASIKRKQNNSSYF